MIHCIIMSSSYTKGTRIAIDYCSENMEKEVLLGRINEIMVRCGEDVAISTHYIQTDSALWSSVCKKDPFFENVEVIEDLDYFIDLINQDRELNGLDVANYILSKITCTHLKLEKLVYLCYADYLCNTGRKLFKDNIYAFRYGPVIDSVYEKYKRKYGTLESEKDERRLEKKSIRCNGEAEMPAKSRILFASRGVEKYNSIEETIERYGDFTAGELVEITHRNDTPWNKSLSGQYYDLISDEVILQFHCNESK